MPETQRSLSTRAEPTRSWVSVTAGSPDARAENAPVAVGRSVLVIVWHLLSDPQARYDLGADIDGDRLSPNRKTRTHVRQLEALGDNVTLEPAA